MDKGFSVKDNVSIFLVVTWQKFGMRVTQVNSNHEDKAMADYGGWISAQAGLLQLVN